MTSLGPLHSTCPIADQTNGLELVFSAGALHPVHGSTRWLKPRPNPREVMHVLYGNYSESVNRHAEMVKLGQCGGYL